jgi:hypothetical protein
LITIDCNDEDENASESIHFNREFDSNEIDESEEHQEEQDGSRVSSVEGITIDCSDKHENAKLFIAVTGSEASSKFTDDGRIIEFLGANLTTTAMLFSRINRTLSTTANSSAPTLKLGEQPFNCGYDTRIQFNIFMLGVRTVMPNFRISEILKMLKCEILREGEKSLMRFDLHVTSGYFGRNFSLFSDCFHVLKKIGESNRHRPIRYFMMTLDPVHKQNPWRSYNSRIIYTET